MEFPFHPFAEALRAGLQTLLLCAFALAPLGWALAATGRLRGTLPSWLGTPMRLALCIEGLGALLVLPSLVSVAIIWDWFWLRWLGTLLALFLSSAGAWLSAVRRVRPEPSLSIAPRP